MQMLLFLSLILLIAGAKSTVGSPCDDGWFGPDCQYKCRCTDNKCDVEGECTGGAWCEKGWFGPACQYVDLVTSYANKKTPLWLRDGDDSTCNDDETSESVIVYFDKRFIYTWLRVHLKDPEVVNNFTFQLRGYDGNFDPKSVVSKVDKFTVDIKQVLPTWVFNYIVFTGPGIKSFCSVYINGGRNVALRQNTTQTSILDDGLSAPSHAVDGNTDGNYTHGSCTETLSESTPTWTIKFQHPVAVNRFITTGRQDRDLEDLRMCLFKGGKDPYYHHFSEGRKAGETAADNFWITSRFDPLSTLSIYVLSVASKSETPTLSLCEFELYGDSICPAGKYGRDCEHTCNCAVKNETCFVSTGGCPSGCAAGYQGENCQVPTFCSGAGIAKIDGKCVKLMDERVTWQEAKAACEALGPAVSLLELTSASVREYVQNITVVLASRTWLGATDAATEGNWVWSSSGNKAEIDPSWWGQGQPDNSYGDEDCLIMRPDKLLNDYGCNNRLPYFCQTLE